MELNSEAYAPLQGYALPNDKTKLLFVYSVHDGEATPPGVSLDLREFSVIQLNGGSITGATTGLDVNFDLMSSPYGSLGMFRIILIRSRPIFLILIRWARNYD